MAAVGHPEKMKQYSFKTTFYRSVPGGGSSWNLLDTKEAAPGTHCFSFHAPVTITPSPPTCRLELSASSHILDLHLPRLPIAAGLVVDDDE